MPYSDLERIQGLKVLRSFPLSRCTSFRIGGPARCLVVPKDLGALEDVLEYMDRQGLPFRVLGRGTNLLVSDQGAGIVLSLAGMKGVDLRGPSVGTGGYWELTADAGVKMQVLLAWSARSGLSGLEDMAGIPGSIGGAVRMNAGTRHGAIHRVLSHVRLTGPGGSKWLAASSLCMGYRHAELPRGVLISAARLRLSASSRGEVYGRVRSAIRSRLETQPLGVPSAGCVFKNPEGDSAGRLIDMCGLKGRTRGRAMVSRKHANFIVNTGGATATDVAGLMALVRGTIMQATGIELKPEIALWGEDIQDILG